jgi:hypothetical protein
MYDAFVGLGAGMVFAIVLVYMLMPVNFQMALPCALVGILWMLFITETTLSVPALMGASMSIGVATANSISLVTFANEQRQEGHDAISAALSAGFTRLRPELMTALAMIIGMLPMAPGLSEGGEQNAPLGRGVIGGLSMATLTKLFFVPVVYSQLEELQSFRRVMAPFHGIIMARNVEVGALITAGSSTTTPQLLRIARIDTFRIYTNVPQSFVPSIRPGQIAQVLLQESPPAIICRAGGPYSQCPRFRRAHLVDGGAAEQSGRHSAAWHVCASEICDPPCQSTLADPSEQPDNSP